MYYCIEKGHKLKWYRKNTKRENWEGAWFHCQKCEAQSGWISKGNLPPSVDWDLLEERDHLDYVTTPFVRKSNGEPNDYQILRENGKETPTPDPGLDEVEFLRAEVKKLRSQIQTMQLRWERQEMELLSYRRKGFQAKPTVKPFR